MNYPEYQNLRFTEETHDKIEQKLRSLLHRSDEISKIDTLIENTNQIDELRALAFCLDMHYYYFSALKVEHKILQM